MIDFGLQVLNAGFDRSGGRFGGLSLGGRGGLLAGSARGIGLCRGDHAAFGLGGDEHDQDDQNTDEVANDVEERVLAGGFDLAFGVTASHGCVGGLVFIMVGRREQAALVPPYGLSADYIDAAALEGGFEVHELTLGTGSDFDLQHGLPVAVGDREAPALNFVLHGGDNMRHVVGCQVGRDLYNLRAHGCRRDSGSITTRSGWTLTRIGRVTPM